MRRGTIITAPTAAAALSAQTPLHGASNATKATAAVTAHVTRGSDRGGRVTNVMASTTGDSATPSNQTTIPNAAIGALTAAR